MKYVTINFFNQNKKGLEEVMSFHEKRIGLIKTALLALASQMAKQLSVLLWNLTQMNKNGTVGKE